MSTHRSISLKNLEEAPNARRIVTPEIVSPYIEYKGDRVTESACMIHQYFITSIVSIVRTYRGDARPEMFVHRSILQVSIHFLCQSFASLSQLRVNISLSIGQLVKSSFTIPIHNPKNCSSKDEWKPSNNTNSDKCCCNRETIRNTVPKVIG